MHPSLQFAVGLVIGIYGYSYYVFVVRLCIRMVRLEGDRRGGRALGRKLRAESLRTELTCSPPSRIPGGVSLSIHTFRVELCQGHYYLSRLCPRRKLTFVRSAERG